ncbi:MAG: hypothetical protein ACOX1A_01420 [Saccharofermentanales bacterium]|jgi:hypothetical protein|nr:hypothetical protein [Clostridiaceae bacterium]
MDYVFFAFSSLCVSFSFLLAFKLADRRDRPLHVLFLILSAAAGFGYYYLEKTFFAKDILLYYLGNSLPQIILLVLLGLFIWKSKAS